MCLRGQVIFDPLTSGLEAESSFRPEAKQIIAGRYVVIQYLGAGMFCHTLQCEDLKGEGENRFVCVKISKNTKDILDQNLWEVSRRGTACHPAPLVPHLRSTVALTDGTNASIARRR